MIEYGELERVGGGRPIAGECAVGMRDECQCPAMVNEGTFALTCSTDWLLMLYNCHHCASAKATLC
ncbi:hypothetical protein ACNKHK_08285 [Shigella flexneri]